MGRKPPVVIVRKDKRLKKTGHLAAFLLTGGTSGVYTAAKAATNASYNARTRQLQAQSEASDDSAGRSDSGTMTVPGQPPANVANFDPAAAFRRDHVPGSAEYQALHGDGTAPAPVDASTRQASGCAIALVVVVFIAIVVLAVIALNAANHP